MMMFGIPQEEDADHGALRTPPPPPMAFLTKGDFDEDSIRSPFMHSLEDNKSFFLSSHMDDGSFADQDDDEFFLVRPGALDQHFNNNDMFVSPSRQCPALPTEDFNSIGSMDQSADRRRLPSFNLQPRAGSFLNPRSTTTDDCKRPSSFTAVPPKAALRLSSKRGSLGFCREESAFSNGWRAMGEPRVES